jgi:hypothetical protein
MIVPCNPLVCMVMDNATNNVDASTLQIVSIEYHRILQITQIFSNL